MPERILLVEDEPAMVRTLVPVLEAENYSMSWVMNAGEALTRAREGIFDVVLLDLGLPDGDGKDIIGELQALGCRTVIVLSARNLESEKVAALDRGADDYLNKPFGIDELMARIRAATRRSRRADGPPAALTVGEFSIDFGTRRVFVGDAEVRLSKKEYALLECLCLHAGQIVTRRQLLLAGWDNPDIDDQNLRVYMTMLRQKLGDDKSDPRFIRTEAGVGYRFMLEG